MARLKLAFVRITACRDVGRSIASSLAEREFQHADRTSCERSEERRATAGWPLLVARNRSMPSDVFACHFLFSRTWLSRQLIDNHLEMRIDSLANRQQSTTAIARVTRSHSLTTRCESEGLLSPSGSGVVTSGSSTLTAAPLEPPHRERRTRDARSGPHAEAS
jgi:hypothetical protein